MTELRTPQTWQVGRPARGVFKALVLCCCVLLYATRPTALGANIDFNRDIRPILSENCFFCHGPDASERKANLRLDLQAGAYADLGGYFAVVPGDPDQSELLARVTTDDEDDLMPPPDSGKKLTSHQTALLRDWIVQGAPWAWHWAYEPPVKRTVPSVTQIDWTNNWIDRFVLARLEKEGLEPAPKADDVTLVRRLSFDLTGLPPAPEAVKKLRNAPTPNTYENLVDALLASPQYAERMAMYWLDLVRYADTVGYHGDQDHNISPYRDYVIDAFNDNKPFDRFTSEQLAGDLMPKAGNEQWIATGYNRLLQTSHEGGVQPKEYLAIYAADRVRNLSAVWLGGTLGCAQCHDHKYDPYTSKDFYAMQAFFADIDEADHFKTGSNALPTKRTPERRLATKNERLLLESLNEDIQVLRQQLRSASDDSAEIKSRLRQRLDWLRFTQNQIRASARATMITVAIQPRTIRVLPRGDWLDDSGPVVTAAVPEFLGDLDAGDQAATRLDLAHWLTDPDRGIGGLTARVFVNRLWYLFFGAGLSNSLDDFGGQGEPPVHPELLDHLAVEFYESGWNVKHMIRLMVTSQTYQQASLTTIETRQRDPDNRLLARQSRFRLPAEAIRDNALAIAGLLNLEYGGATAKPYQPAGYYRHLNFPTRQYQTHKDTRQWRRGIYIHWQRQFLHPMLRAFDAPGREECTAQRPRSNTPVSALALLNDPSLAEAARVFAQRIIRESAPTFDRQLEFAFRQSLSRGPSGQERELLRSLYESNNVLYSSHPTEARRLLENGIASIPPDIDAVRLATWTQVARAILNLNETNTRN